MRRTLFKRAHARCRGAAQQSRSGGSHTISTVQPSLSRSFQRTVKSGNRRLPRAWKSLAPPAGLEPATKRLTVEVEWLTFLKDGNTGRVIR